MGLMGILWLSSLTHAQINADIIGGSPASPEAYPWMVALVSSSGADNYDAQFCGGTLVHPRWVVTAAHCVNDLSPSDLHAIVGAHGLDDPTLERIAIDAIYVHPDYSRWTDDSDIALLRLATPSDAPWAPLISDTLLDEPGLIATAIGWGATNRLGTLFPTLLEEVELPIVSNEDANKFISLGGRVTSNMLAAGYLVGGKDTCGGDSGGPLVVYNPDIDSLILAGVVSWGQGCARPLKYGVYTRVHNFRHWALGHMMLGYRTYEDENGVRGRLHDPDLDGYPNLLEYAHNTDPNNEVPAHKPQSALVELDDTQVPAIRYRRLSATDLIAYHPEISLDGGSTWISIDPVLNQVGPPEYVDADTEWVTVRCPAPLIGWRNGLFRVRIEQRP